MFFCTLFHRKPEWYKNMSSERYPSGLEPAALLWTHQYLQFPSALPWIWTWTWTWTRVGPAGSDQLQSGVGLQSLPPTRRINLTLSSMPCVNTKSPVPFDRDAEIQNYSDVLALSTPGLILLTLTSTALHCNSQLPKSRGGGGVGAHHKPNRPRVGGGVRQLNPADPVPVPHEHRRLVRLVPVELAQDRSHVPIGPSASASAPAPAPTAVAPGLTMALALVGGLIGEVLRQEEAWPVRSKLPASHQEASRQSNQIKSGAYYEIEGHFDRSTDRGRYVSSWSRYHRSAF